MRTPGSIRSDTTSANVVKVPKPDWSDALALVGLAMAGVGLWMLSPWAMLVLAGALLTVAALRLGR
jgi:hypothetical protein